MVSEKGDDNASILADDRLPELEDTTILTLRNGESRVGKHTDGIGGRVKQIIGKYNPDIFDVAVDDRTVYVRRKDSMENPVVPYTYLLHADGSGVEVAGYPSPKQN